MKSTTLSQYDNFHITTSGTNTPNELTDNDLSHTAGWRIIQSFKRGDDWFILWGQLTPKSLKAEKKRFNQ